MDELTMLKVGLVTDDAIQPEQVRELAGWQIENYRRQPEELVSHFNREMSALDGYRGRQLLELLQNADDAGVDTESGCELLLNLSRERLIVANTGKPFSKKGLTSLVISDCSPKQLDRNRFIGCKGLGFRSILTWTDRPLISSGPYEVVFDRLRAIETVRQMADANPTIGETVHAFHDSTGRWPAPVMRFPGLPHAGDPWLDAARAHRDESYDTVIVLPLPMGAQGDDIYKEMCDQISRLPTSSLLFCQHLTRVKISGDLEKGWELLRDKHPDGHATVILQEEGTQATELWHVYRHTGQVSAEVAERSSGGRRDFEVAVAVPDVVTPNPAGSLCVFFPTHERLPCSVVMHATLETTDDRNRLVDHASNREVLGHLARHVAEVVESQAAPTAPRRALELLAGIENSDPELTELGFVDTLIEDCAIRSIFPRLDATLQPSANVQQVPHSTWLSELGPDIFPEVLAIGPGDPLGGLLALFDLSWFDPATLKQRLKLHLLRIERGKAGEVLGRLLAGGQLGSVGAEGLLVGADGNLIESGDSFFMPLEKLPPLPAWASNIWFVDEEFQDGLLRESKAGGLRGLASDVSRCGGDVDEYRFDTVARALIDQAEQGADADASTLLQRWRELLRWLFNASLGTRQVLPQLSIKVPTKRNNLRRATACYLGPDYGRGQIVWRLYEQFDQDEFVGTPVDCGLGDVATEDAEEFLIALGVNSAPRAEPFRSGNDYQRFEDTFVDRIDYPRTIRDRICHSTAELRGWCTSYTIAEMRLPDRWLKLLTDGDSVAVVAFLLSSGAIQLAEERDSQAKFQATVESERSYRLDSSVPIPNPMLYFLRETAWVPATDGKRRRPSEIMLSSQGVRVLRGVYSRHSIDMNDPLLVALGGRASVESLLTRLGAVSSLETVSGRSLYELLQALPDRDPLGEVAPGIYRTLMESNVSVDESPHRAGFLSSGMMWGRHNGIELYMPIGQLRYNSNLTLTKVIERHIPLVDIPRRKNTSLVKELFGIQPLTSDEIQLRLLGGETEYDTGSEDANYHLRMAIPYIYALRLARNLDDRGRELNLLRKATLRVCTQAQVVATLPGGSTEEIVLKDVGERIVIDTMLIVVGDYRETGSGFLTFWLNVAELVAELLGIDVADEVGGLLRCRTPAEMLEVVRVRLGSDADAKLAEARSRFEKLDEEGDDDKQHTIPPPNASSPSIKPPPGAPAQDGSETGTGGKSEEDKSAGTTTIFEPVAGPSGKGAKKRRLVVTGPVGTGGGGVRGPLATEPITFKVVEAFERYEGRFIVPVSHLRGSDGFGCDLLSVASKAIRDLAMADHSITDADILRYIEVKGRSSRAGDVELSDNEYATAKRVAGRYWLYRVFVDPNKEAHFQVALLCDPLNSHAARTVTRFHLAEGSGASWYSLVEKPEDEPKADEGKTESTVPGA
jgi:hypothetical protein